jgi:hypothetical protein
MTPGVLAYAPGGLRNRFRGYDLRLMPPTVIGVLENIAMVAGEITATADLQDVLAYVRRHDANSGR